MSLTTLSLVCVDKQSGTKSKKVVFRSTNPADYLSECELVFTNDSQSNAFVPGDVLTLTFESAPTLDVALTTPADEAEDVVVAAFKVHVYFNERMDPATLVGANLIILNDADAPVASTVAIVAGSDNKHATITPNAPLTAGATYRIKITTGAHDLGGHALAAQYLQATGFTMAA